MAWVRYILNKDVKTLNIDNQKFTFPKNKWVDVKYAYVERKAYEFPDVFEVADFDISMIEGIDNIRCHGKMIHTSDVNAIEKLNSRRWFKLKYQDNIRSIFYVCMTDDRYNLLSLLENSKPGTVGVYRVKGGWGDIVMAYSVARSVAAKYPKLKIIFSSPTNFRDLVDADKNIEWQEFRKFINAGYDAYIDLTSPCIRHERTFQPNVKFNRPEIFAQECMLQPADVKPYAPIKPDALAWAKDKLSKLPRPWFGFVPESCAPIRNWWGWDKVTDYCTDKYSSTNLIFNASDISLARLNNNTPIIGKSMSRVVALLSICDAVFGVDTGPMHSASANSVPTIWVFTHIDGAIRTKGYKNATVVQNKESCPRCPCWYESPCSDGRQSPCGEAVEIKHVTDEIDKIWKPTALTQI